MAEKNVKINVKADSGYDTLYPLSKAENISFNKNNSDLKSTNIKDAIEELDEDFLLTFNLSDTVQPTSEGNALVESIEGDTWQGENPSPEYPQHIYGLGDTGYFDGELQQGYYNASGAYTNTVNYVCSVNPIPCVPGDNIAVVLENASTSVIVSFFQENGTFISQQTGTTATAPANTAYCMISINQTGITPQTAGHIAVTINGKYAVKVNTMSANLFGASKLPTTSAGGATVTNNGDGSFNVSGSGNLSSTFNLIYFFGKSDFLKPGKITLNINLENIYPWIRVFGLSTKGDASVVNRTFDISNNGYIELTEEILSKTVDVCIMFYGEMGKKIITGTIKPMLYQDGDGTFVPFQDETAYLPLSSPLYKGDQIVKIGNEYKVRRENGYIQSYSSESIPGEYVSSTGELSSGSTVVYKLATPVYEDIDQDQFYSIMAADELTNISLLGENENLVPINVIRFPRNEDGALSTSAFANSNKNKKLINEVEFNIGNLSSLKTDSNETLVEAINEVNSHADTAQSNIGTLTSLTTDSKTNLVGAINEVDSHANSAQTTANTNKTNIGTLSSLKTAVKTSIVNAINSLYDNTIGKTLKTLDEVKVATEKGYYVDALAIKELNNKVPHIVTGRVNIQCAPKRNETVSISFTGYSEKPIVIVTLETGWADTQQATAHTITTTGAKITNYNSSTANATITAMYVVIGY